MASGPLGIIPVQDLPTIPPSQQGYLVTVDPAMDKVAKTVIPDIQAAAAVVGQQVGAMLSAATQQVTFLVNSARAELDVDIAEINQNIATILAETISEASSVLSSVGYLVPVDYQAGLVVNSSRFTVRYDGQVYAPTADSLPFTTDSIFAPSQWRIVQGIVASDLAGGEGASLVGFEQIGAAPKIRPVQEKLRDLQVSANDFAGVLGDGVNDDTFGLSNAFATRRQVVLKRGHIYRVTSSITCPEGAQVFLEEGASIVGSSGAILFSGVSAGTVDISGRGEISGFSKLVDFSSSGYLKRLRLRDFTYTGTQNSTAAAVGSVVSYFPSDVHIETIEVEQLTILNGREGFIFRGTWDSATVRSNKVRGVQHYGLRLGQDRDEATWDTQGHADVTGNDVRNMYNPLVGAGSNECNAISVFCKSANVHANYVENINGAGVDDIEGIYTKIQHGNVYGNVLVDACRREGAICLKEASRKSGTDYDQRNTINVYGNVVFFTLSRSHEASISVQTHNVNVFGNFVQTGAGIASESSGIEVKYRSPYRNINIHDNLVYCPNAGYGIHAWAYGENVRIKNNYVFGVPSRAVMLETRSSADVRYPSTAPIGRNYIVSDNMVSSYAVGAITAAQRGLQFAISAATPITGVQIKGNTLIGAFSERQMAIDAAGSLNWYLEENNFAASTGTFLLSNLPNNIWVRANRGFTSKSRGTATLGGGSSTSTVVNSINPALAAFMGMSDVGISPTSAGFFSRACYVSSIFTSGNFVVTGANSGGDATFRWEASVEDRPLNSLP